MFTDISCSDSFEAFAIESAPVKIRGEEFASIFFRPVVALIDHHAGVRVSSARLVRGWAQSFLFQVSPFFLPYVPMMMIGGLVDQFVQVRLRMLSIHPLVVGTWHGMPEMTDHCVYEEELAVSVPIMAP